MLASYASAGGAGGWLTKMLGACVLSFSLQLYAYRKPLVARARQIVGTAILGTFTSMLMSAAAARAIRAVQSAPCLLYTSPSPRD